MRLSPLQLLCLAGFANVTLAAILPNSATSESGDTSIRKGRRGFDNFGFPLVNDLEGKTETSHPDHTTTDAPLHHATDGITSIASEPSPTTTGTATTIETKKVKEKETATAPSGTSSVLATTPFHSPSSSPAAPTPSPAPSSTAPAHSPGADAVSASSSNSDGGSSKEWKIIGVAVIAFSTVAAILLLSVFFDQWWRFVSDLLWRRRRRDAEEELVPDWEKAEWDLRCGDRHRYPSFTSLPSVPIVHPLGTQAQAESQSEKRIQSPPRAAFRTSSTRKDVQAYGKGPSKPLDGSLGIRSPSTSRFSQTDAGYAGIGVGLGLGHVGSMRSVSRSGHTVSPRMGGNHRSPAAQDVNRAANARGAVNPFDDFHSPMPEDVYGGMAK